VPKGFVGLAAALTLSAAGVAQSQVPTVVPAAGLVIDHSVRLRPGAYRLASRDLDAPAIIIRGDNVTVDLTGVTLEGGEPFGNPDRDTGVGVLVDGSRGVTIRGGAIRGYKVALLARRAPALHVTGGDFSYNWKPRLLSGIEHESLVDWLTYHHNEQDEWLRYGAAIYLAGSDDAEIDNNRAVQGQNGLLITKSARAKVWNDTFSWMSGLGIGMYRTTDSRIMHNRLDYDVRGYSHGFYNRGQDSAGLLMFEQTSNNIVAYNSITHGGDGVFLWAGQSTMDTGQGGANDNVFLDNDVSHAVANGIEATFSRNAIVGNRIEDCWHGIWGGYSYESLIARNSFAGNSEDISIEHGQNITIQYNTFKGDPVAVHLWANPNQDPTWGYPKARDTASRDYWIGANAFVGVGAALDVAQTHGLVLASNEMQNVTQPVRAGLDVVDLRERTDGAQPDRFVSTPLPLPGGMNAMLPDNARRGRDTIIVDAWGPYDYLSPKIWPVGKLTDRPLKLRVLGPAGKWTLRSIAGGTAGTRAGDVPGEISVTPAVSGDLELALEYKGAEVVTPRGQKYAAGKPVPVAFSVLDPPVEWTAKYWSFDTATDPVTATDKFAAHLSEAPIRTDTLAHLDFVTGGVLGPGLPRDHVALRAEGSVTLPSGAFDLMVISDDGVRVWVDDRLVVDRWSVHESVLDRAPIAGGRHRLRVEYFEESGWAELQVRFQRTSGKPRGTS